MKNNLPVIAIFDVGKTNKKLFFFTQDYEVVYEQSDRFIETVDEDGDPCENLESLRSWVFDALKTVVAKNEFDIRAINFSAYGASFIYVDEHGEALTPLYNYLKPYPEELKKKFYTDYGGEQEFSSRTASPVLGSLNSGMQLYRLKYEQPKTFSQVKHALHLPQYLSYLISLHPCSDITSIGCHTNLWDFKQNTYHNWVSKEGIDSILPPVANYNQVSAPGFANSSFHVGAGLHDSSAALIPYLINFTEPFVLISSGTWCISLNPFNHSPLTAAELAQDCLCYLSYKGQPVKASRLFAGQEHEDATKTIAEHFNVSPFYYREINFDLELIKNLTKKFPEPVDFLNWELSSFANVEEAYHQLMRDIISKQVASTNLILNAGEVKRIFVDGGFSNNPIYMSLLAAAYPGLEIYSASMSQASALGAALAIHDAWNKKSLPANLIHLQYYGSGTQTLK